MADPQKCPRCCLRAYFLKTESGTAIELSVKPSPDGPWAIRKDGVPVVAVEFAAGRVVGRLPGFERTPLFGGHYAECALAAAANVSVRPKTGTR